MSIGSQRLLVSSKAYPEAHRSHVEIVEQDMHKSMKHLHM